MPDYKRLDDCLSIRDGRLYVEERDAVGLVDEFWFAGGRYEHNRHAYLFASKADAPLVGKADIIGGSCYDDRLMPTVRVPEVELGDVRALLDTGAYQEVSMSNFNAIPRPATVLVIGDRAAVIRRRETEEDVLRRDLFRAHLRPGASARKEKL